MESVGHAGHRALLCLIVFVLFFKKFGFDLSTLDEFSLN